MGTYQLVGSRSEVDDVNVDFLLLIHLFKFVTIVPESIAGKNNDDLPVVCILPKETNKLFPDRVK